MADLCALSKTTMCLPDSRKDKQPLFVQDPDYLADIALHHRSIHLLNHQSLYRFFRITEIVISLDLVSLQVVAAVMFFSSAWKYPKLVSTFDTLNPE
ncbi:hypothetical protein J6590_097853 [Homalodisca vitripennis]|nr:hypothetical protein J6590_097853 [Homalodisca vitripennis]